MKIKQRNEDFFVREVTKLNEGKGDYSYFLLKKKGRNTLDVVEELTRRLNKRVGFAGSKDKDAITEQYISIKNVDKKKAEGFKLKGVELKYIGNGNKPISLGDLIGNRFVIIVRDLSNKRYRRANQVINYFDEQRFSRRNVEVGITILKRGFKKVCDLLNLKVRDNDYIGALRAIDRRLLMIYVHSVQSYLWNEVISMYLRKNYKDIFEVRYSLGSFIFVNEEVKNRKVPIIGFLSKFGSFERIIDEVLENNGLKIEDFVIKEMPELNLEGDRRDLVVKVKDLKVKFENDELNNERLKAIVQFKLPKGAYGSLVIKQMFLANV